MRTLALILMTVPMAWGQQAISARSGLVNHVSGDAALSGQNLEPKTGKFWEVKSGQVLETAIGRAEVLLNPGVFLRLDRQSSFRMIDNSLTDSRIELTQGRALIEVLEIAKGNQVTVRVGKTVLQPTKAGLYLIDASENEARIFEGTLVARLDDSTLELGRGKAVSLGPLLLASKFNRKEKDFDLYTWSENRSGAVAHANLVLASAMGNRQSMPSRLGSGWTYFPSYGMFTYMPGDGRLIHNPFGLYYYSPLYIWTVVNRPPDRTFTAENANSGFGARPSAAVYSAPAAVAGSTGNIPRDSGASAPAVSAGGARTR